MKINDENGKVREIRSMKKVVHQVPDRIHKGVFIAVEFVEIIIIGKRLTWTNWIQLDRFRELNPEVEI